MVRLRWPILCVFANVEVLTAKNFDEFVNSRELVLVKFYAVWCGYCKRLAPEFEQAAGELSKLPGIYLAEVDAEREMALGERFNIQGYPTIMLFRKGQRENYDGGRSAGSIVETMVNMKGPALSWVHSAQDAFNANESAYSLTRSLWGSNTNLYVGRFKSSNTLSATYFDRFSEAHRRKGRFVAYEAPDEPERVSIYYPNDQQEHFLIPNKTNLAYEELALHFEEKSTPYFGPISGENYPHYAARSNSWFWFVGSRTDFQRISRVVVPLSKRHRNEFNFVWLDIDANAHHAFDMLGVSEGPAVVVEIGKTKYRYSSDVLDAEQRDLEEFISSVMRGRVKRYIRSESIDIDQTEDASGVRAVVGANVEELVTSGKQDVLLFVYAPWCGHCRRISGVISQVADATRGKVVVAQIDGTANDLPDSLETVGYPTIYFVPKGGQPIFFKEPRTLEHLLAFVREHSTAAFESPPSDGRRTDVEL